MAEKNILERLEKAMDSQYIQEHPDEIIELLVEVRAELEKAGVELYKLLTQLNVRNDIAYMASVNSVKRFAEKLENKLANNTEISAVGYESVVADINNIVKEMVGESYEKDTHSL